MAMTIENHVLVEVSPTDRSRIIRMVRAYEDIALLSGLLPDRVFAVQTVQYIDN